MFRSIVLGLALSTFTATLATAETAPAPKAEYAKTCGYFEKRALAHRNGDRGAWLRLLAESCGEALRRTQAQESGGALADTAYLTRLNTLRDVVIGMNVARFTQNRGLGRTRSTMTASGEYLIARRIGVMAAYSAWAEASGFDMARLSRN